VFAGSAREKEDNRVASASPLPTPDSSLPPDGEGRTDTVKDGMERSGMRWTEGGAEAMLKLRATYLSRDFDEYWAFHVMQEQLRLYPLGLWRPLQVSA